MNVQPRIEIIEEKKLVGHHLKMSLVNNLTFQLWSGFGPEIKSIQNRTSEKKYSLQVYDKAHFRSFDPSKEFEKWALVEVEDFDDLKPSLSTFVLPGGMYAVFDYKGTSADSGKFFQYIYSEWVLGSGYLLDNRPHFELLGAKYKNNDPLSEEEIWIPIRKDPS